MVVRQKAYIPNICVVFQQDLVMCALLGKAIKIALQYVLLLSPEQMSNANANLSSHMTLKFALCYLIVTETVCCTLLPLRQVRQI